MINLRPPNISRTNNKEDIDALVRYLITLVDSLNLILGDCVTNQTASDEFVNKTDYEKKLDDLVTAIATLRMRVDNLSQKGA